MRLSYISSFMIFATTVVGVIGSPSGVVNRRFVLPSLADWTQEHLSTLNSASTNADIDAAADAFLSKSVVIEINGASVTRAAFIKTFKNNIVNRVNTTMNFIASVEVPTDSQNPIAAGWVGYMFSTASVFGTPATTQVGDEASDNILVQQDPSITPPPATSPIRGDFDGRRVFSIQRVLTEATIAL